MRYKRLSGIAALAASLVVWGFGALEAQAVFVRFPKTLDQLLPAGNFTTVQQPNKLETFSNFAFSAGPCRLTPACQGHHRLCVSPRGERLTESGLTFTGALFAPAGTVVDYAISFRVTAPPSTDQRRCPVGRLE